MADLHFRNFFTSFTLWNSHFLTFLFSKLLTVLDPVHWNGSRTELRRSHAKEGSDPGTDPRSEPFREHIFNRS